MSGASFRAHTLATDLKGGYQVVAADLNHDGKPDLVALSSGMDELLWFENPAWKRHVLAGGVSRAINLAVLEEAEGGPLIVLAEEFSMEPRKSAGVLSVLRPDGDVRRPWKKTEFDRLPSAHRVRWADIDGSGRRVAVVAPLAGANAEPPDYRTRVPLVYYRPGVWKREPISDELEGVMHGLWIVDWDGRGRDDILTASFGGIDLFQHSGGADGKWSRRRLARGSPEAWPRCGSSDVAVGRLGRERFLCAIEPWHGNVVAVYRERGGEWRREAIDESFVDGHALLTGDLDGDGRDEIIAGYRGKGRSVYIYRADAEGRWERRGLDEGGMGAASCAVADLNGDGRPDIACIESTGLKWYENVR